MIQSVKGNGREPDGPPDLFELMKKLTGGGRGRGRSPGNFGGGVIAIILVVLLVWGAMTSFYTVQPEQRAVVKRFGSVTGITDPGLHFKIPFGIDKIQLVATERVLKQEFGFSTLKTRQGERSTYSAAQFEDESLMLTGDLNMIDVEWVVQYRIEDPIKFLYQMREPTRTLRDISESVMRRIVGNMLGSEVLTIGRVEIQQKAGDEIQEILDQYDAGIRISTVEMQDVVPPRAVQPAFNEVNEARQERERMINEAQKRVNQEIPNAEGAALRTVAEAEGYATERVNRAVGESARFSAVLHEYQQAPIVTRSRLYLETLNEMLPDIGQILVVQDGQMSPLPLLDVNRNAIGGDK
ncbi:MAG: FtsH protease activity modulator HflK [Methylophaga sp.]|uniref:FtsH protease activity modulator HflK n=1 Tax=Methylophaga sp. UBA678 TaxID=1946901 RepID=UPI000C50C984|nr:FtsH protease activity modulator HflK [Methylophaga sp. UBA678]MAX50458.1 FtsH protease activity modulator HflK [Methylophaga sp.]|tara:strand:+ start:122375 stop:123433 length:1059 start_codon:yes stop_codon:yes gene_type:complete